MNPSGSPHFYYKIATSMAISVVYMIYYESNIDHLCFSPTPINVQFRLIPTQPYQLLYIFYCLHPPCTSKLDLQRNPNGETA